MERKRRGDEEDGGGRRRTMRGTIIGNTEALWLQLLSAPRESSERGNMSEGAARSHGDANGSRE